MCLMVLLLYFDGWHQSGAWCLQVTIREKKRLLPISVPQKVESIFHVELGYSLYTWLVKKNQTSILTANMWDRLCSL